MKRKIKQILIDGAGWLYSHNGEIKSFTKNGEMAEVEWFRQGNIEVNGKYVIKVEFEDLLTNEKICQKE